MSDVIRDPARHPQARGIERYRHIRAFTRSLVAPLSAEDCAIQSMPEASPTKWHLAHTTWFFETFILARRDPKREPFHPAFRMLFNSYYNAVGERHPRPQRGLLSRPSLDEVLAYRAAVEDDLAPLIGGELDEELEALVELGIQHEQQHQELLLTDVKHMLSCNPLRPAYQKTWPLTSVEARRPSWISIARSQNACTVAISWVTSTCPSQPAPAPMPIVGILTAARISSAKSSGTHSTTTAKAPAFSMARASSMSRS